MGEVWELAGRDGVLGRLTVRYLDQPTFHCDFEPAPAFSLVANAFADELNQLNEGDMAEWERTYQKVDDLGLVLINPESGARIEAPLIHVDGGSAWFRY